MRGGRGWSHRKVKEHRVDLRSGIDAQKPIIVGLARDQPVFEGGVHSFAGGAKRHLEGIVPTPLLPGPFVRVYGLELEGTVLANLMCCGFGCEVQDVGRMIQGLGPSAPAGRVEGGGVRVEGLELRGEG